MRPCGSSWRTPCGTGEGRLTAMMIALCKDTSPDRASRPKHARRKRGGGSCQDDEKTWPLGALDPAAVNATEELQDE
jgi:hypothetical protein